MNIILCEGKRDVWFFHEAMKDYFEESDIHYTPESEISEIQGQLSSACINYLNNKFSLVIFGDKGRPVIYEKYLQRIVVDTLGKVKFDIILILVIDDDGSSYDDLKDKILSKLRSISKDKSKFTNLPSFQNNTDSFVLIHPKSRGSITIKVLTVPRSLEDQVTEKIIKDKYPHECKILKKGADKTLETLVTKHYNNEEELFREAYTFLKDESWVQNILILLKPDDN